MVRDSHNLFMTIGSDLHRFDTSKSKLPRVVSAHSTFAKPTFECADTAHETCDDIFLLLNAGAAPKTTNENKRT
jgi:hypothetical protein